MGRYAALGITQNVANGVLSWVHDTKRDGASGSSSHERKTDKTSAFGEREAGRFGPVEKTASYPQKQNLKERRSAPIVFPLNSRGVQGNTSRGPNAAAKNPKRWLNARIDYRMRPRARVMGGTHVLSRSRSQWAERWCLSPGPGMLHAPHAGFGDEPADAVHLTKRGTSETGCPF